MADRLSRTPLSTSSDKTLNGEREQERQKCQPEQDSSRESGQEEKGQQVPPPPVGFFDQPLDQTRITLA